MKNNKSHQEGIIKMIILIIIAIAVLSYFGINIKDFFTSPQAKENFGLIWNFITNIWDNYLVEPSSYLWNIWVQYIWTPFIEMLTRSNHADIVQ